MPRVTVRENWLPLKGFKHGSIYKKFKQAAASIRGALHPSSLL